MKKNRLFISMLLLLSCGLEAWAQQSSQQLVVWQKNGEKVYFNLDEEPETTFEGTQLVIKTSKTTVFYQIQNVLRYTFEGPMTAIDSPKLRPNEVIFRQGSDQISFEGLPDGTILEVFSLDGKKISAMKARGGQQTILSLTSQPAGTYIVKIGEATYKFQKR